MGKPNKYKNNLGLSANAHEFSLAGLGCKNEKKWLKGQNGQSPINTNAYVLCQIVWLTQTLWIKRPKGSSIINKWKRRFTQVMIGLHVQGPQVNHLIKAISVLERAMQALTHGHRERTKVRICLDLSHFLSIFLSLPFSFRSLSLLTNTQT